MPESIEDRFQNLHEFIKVARANLNRNAWDYLIGASETETTVARNRLALDALGFRPRVLCDVSEVDCSASLFGRKRLFVLCIFLFTLSSVLCGSAPSLSLLIVFRVLQGVGGAVRAAAQQLPARRDGRAAQV